MSISETPPEFSDGLLIETTDEEGVVHFFEKLQEFEHEDQQYALLIYHGTEEDVKSASESGSEEGDDEDEDSEEEIILMRVVHDGDSPVYEHIDDDAEFEKIVSYLETLGEDELGGWEMADSGSEEAKGAGAADSDA